MLKGDALILSDDDLVNDAKNKKFEEIENSDLAVDVQELAMASVIVYNDFREFKTRTRVFKNRGGMLGEVK